MLYLGLGLWFGLRTGMRSFKVKSGFAVELVGGSTVGVRY